jgi:hypothetical protein
MAAKSFSCVLVKGPGKGPFKKNFPCEYPEIKP